MFLAAVAVTLGPPPCLAAQDDDVAAPLTNDIPTTAAAGLFTDAEVAEIESVMPLPEAMALIYMVGCGDNWGTRFLPAAPTSRSTSYSLSISPPKSHLLLMAGKNSMLQRKYSYFAHP